MRLCRLNALICDWLAAAVIIKSFAQVAQQGNGEWLQAASSIRLCKVTRMLYANSFPTSTPHLHLHLQFNPYTSIFPRCRQHHAEGGWHPRVALEALQQAGVLQSVPQHVGGSRQEGSLLCA